MKISEVRLVSKSGGRSGKLFLRACSELAIARKKAKHNHPSCASINNPTEIGAIWKLLLGL